MLTGYSQLSAYGLLVIIDYSQAQWISAHRLSAHGLLLTQCPVLSSTLLSAQGLIPVYCSGLLLVQCSWTTPGSNFSGLEPSAVGYCVVQR